MTNADAVSILSVTVFNQNNCLSVPKLLESIGRIPNYSSIQFISITVTLISIKGLETSTFFVKISEADIYISPTQAVHWPVNARD